MDVYLAQPRGFCAGVVRAIQIVERALEKYGPPVYVRHEIVHNKYVVESLKNKGAIFVEDVNGLALPVDTPVAYITQTTLSVDDTKDIILALQHRFTDIQGPDIRDICYATQNRQSAVRDLSKLVDVILVVGATNSSNSNRLREIGTEAGVASYLIADGSELN